MAYICQSQKSQISKLENSDLQYISHLMEISILIRAYWLRALILVLIQIPIDLLSIGHGSDFHILRIPYHQLHAHDQNISVPSISPTSECGSIFILKNQISQGTRRIMRGHIKKSEEN